MFNIFTEFRYLNFHSSCNVRNQNILPTLKYLIQMSSYPSFDDLADQIIDKKQFNDIIARQQKFFQINPYKIQKLYTETVKKIYAQIHIKYQVTKQFKVLENIWHENQRRVFVWYMIVLFDTRSLNVQPMTQINWDQLCPIFFDKSASFLEFQFANILKSKCKITWNQEEDRILLQSMSKEKPGKWNQVSKRIFYESGCKLFKSPKHCRERWFNHLDQSKNKGSWTLQQDYAIFKFIIEKGKRWACIVKQMGNSRTEHMIKNRYNSLIIRLKKNKKRREQEMAELVYKALEADVKNEKRGNKLRNQENFDQQKKIENLQIQTPLQHNTEKSFGSLDEEKSDNSTLKNGEVKIEEEIKVEEESLLKNKEILNQMNENVWYQNNNFLNFYDYRQEYVGNQGFPMFYYCQPSAFMPVNSMYPLLNLAKMQNQ